MSQWPSYWECRNALLRLGPIVPGNLRLLLHIILTHSGQDGECWASQETIGQEAGVSPRQVRRGLGDLEEMGLVNVTRRGKTQTSLIRINWDEVTGHLRPVTGESDRTSMSAVTGHLCPTNTPLTPQESDRTSMSYYNESAGLERMASHLPSERQRLMVRSIPGG